MFTAAFDARMDNQRAFLSVGGFLAPAAGWIAFDGEWRERLTRDGLSYFHMEDFANSVGDFEPLRKHLERSRGLVQDLLGIIVSHAYRKFGVTLAVEAVDAEFADQIKLDAPNALALAGELVCRQAMFWARAEGFPIVEFVFADGDTGLGKLAEQVKALTGVMPTLRPKKDSPQTKAFTPLQAADILVYEMGQLTQGGRPKAIFSYPFQQLNRMPGAIFQSRRRHQPRPLT
jgi:hypothetical protein